MNNNGFRTSLNFPIILVVLMLTSGMNTLWAQEENEKQRARISLDYFSVNNAEQRLVATVKSRVEGYFINVPDVTIRLYRDIISEETFLESKATGMDGKAVFTISSVGDTTRLFTYVATIENDPSYQDADRDVTVTRAQMDMTLEEEDSVKTVRIFVGTPDSSGNMSPVEGVVVKISVNRLFGLMPVTQDLLSTDEEGNATMEFPDGIPGDNEGNLTVVAQVSDHDEFGNLEVRKVKSWGAPVKLDKADLKKELWVSSSNTPRLLLITVNMLILGVVGVIVYIVRLLIHIKKLGNVPEDPGMA